MAREVFHPAVADIGLDTVLGALSDPPRRAAPHSRGGATLLW